MLLPADITRAASLQLRRGLRIAAAAIVLGIPGMALAAGSPQFIKPVSSQINSTGKAITMPVPLTVGEQSLGDIVIIVNTDDSVAIPKSALLDKLGPVLDKAATDRLAAAPDSNGNLTLETLKSAGFDISFNPRQLALTYQPKGDDRSAGDVSLGGGSRTGGNPSATLASPAYVSGYVNFGAGVDHTWGDGSSADPTALNFDIQSVMRVSAIAFAADWSYQSTAEPFICPVGAICLNDQAGGFKRAYTRGIYDRPDYLTRLEFGDTEPLGTEFQTPTDTLGFSLEHSANKLAPGENLGPTGGSSFRLDRPSDVDVIVNGMVVRHMHLAPGPYNLRDIPLQAGTNEVTLEITDDTGQRRTQTFTTVFDGGLLAAGKSEWALSGGVPSYLSDNERVYRSTYLTGTAFYRYGLSDSLTGEIETQADNDVAEGGGRVLAGLPFGFVTTGGAVSAGRLGSGFALDASWSLPTAKIFLRGTQTGRESLSLTSEYRSVGFHTPGEYLATAGNVIYPQYDYSWRFTGFYSAPVTDKITASLSGRYSLATTASAATLQPDTFTGNRYGVDLAVSAPINSWMDGSISAGYGNDSYIDPNKDQADFHVGFRLSVRPDEHSTVMASYDTENRQATVSADRDFGRGVDRWNASVQVNNDGLDNSGTAGASLDYTGNRFEARASQSAGYQDGSLGGGGSSQSVQRTSLWVGTAIAFADGKIAVGAPVRGDSFAIVYPHESLAGKPITVGNGDMPRAYADGWGPALVGDVPAYSASSLSVDVADLPLGYSLGQGAYDMKAPYKSGYALEVGSSHSVAAYGTLMGADSHPIALLTGTATREGDAAHQVAVFTNAAGRFGADGLAPGRWIIEMATDGGPTRFAIDIPAGTNGLFKAGTLTPLGGQ